MKWGKTFLLLLIVFAFIFSFVFPVFAYTMSPIYPQSSLFGNGVYRYLSGGIYFYANDDPASPTSNGTGLAMYHKYIYDITASELVNDLDFSGLGVVQSWRNASGILTRWALAPSGASWISQHSYNVIITVYQGSPPGNGYGVSGTMSCVVENLQVGGGYYALGEYGSWVGTTSASANSFSCDMKSVVVNITTNFDTVTSCDFTDTSEVLSHSFSGSPSDYGYLTLIYDLETLDDTYNYSYTVHGTKDGDPVEATNDFDVVVSCETILPTDIQYKIVVQPNRPNLTNPQSSVLYLYKSIDKGTSWSLVATSLYSCDVTIDTVVGDEDENISVISLGGNAYRIESDINTGSDLYLYTVVVSGLTLTGKFYMSGDPDDVVTTIYDDTGEVITEVMGLQGIWETIANALKNLALTFKQAIIDAMKYLFIPTSSNFSILLASGWIDVTSPIPSLTPQYTIPIPFGVVLGEPTGVKNIDFKTSFVAWEGYSVVQSGVRLVLYGLLIFLVWSLIA